MANIRAFQARDESSILSARTKKKSCIFWYDFFSFFKQDTVAAESSLLEKGMDSTDDNLHCSIASSDTILLVTVDSDAKIAAKKGNNPLKGNSPRPIYPRVARANRLAGHTFSVGDGFHRSVADLEWESYEVLDQHR